MLRPHNITDILFSHEDEGYSVNVQGETPVDGYMVGGAIPSLVLKADEMYPFRATDKWLTEHWTLLNGEPGLYAGIWKDSETGLTYVDISRNVADLYTALAIASSRGEIAIWDVASAKEVRTEEESTWPLQSPRNAAKN